MKSIFSFARNQFVLSIAAAGAACLALGMSSAAQASTFTRTSLVNGGVAVPTGVSEVGGIVLDLIGANNNRVTTQLSASSLYVGFAGQNPETIGTQTGFGTSITDALGGGLLQAAVRLTLFDGDTAAGDFDEDDNSLLLNGINFGNWSDVQAQNTDGLGTVAFAGFSGGGFRDNILDTGWFLNSDSTSLAAFYSSLLSTQEVVFSLNDIDPFDNFFDFTQGVDSSLIDVGTGPVVTPGGGGSPASVPEPGSVMALLLIGGAGVLQMRRRVASQAV